MRAQHIELIYSQSGLLYNFFPDAPRSILDNARQMCHGLSMVEDLSQTPCVMSTLEVLQRCPS
jgi:hypothetical protein